jgi:hypothetical protein
LYLKEATTINDNTAITTVKPVSFDIPPLPYMMNKLVAISSVLLLAVSSATAFQNAQPFRAPASPVSKGSFSPSSIVEKWTKSGKKASPPMFMQYPVNNGNANVQVAEKKREALSVQIHNLETALEEQKESVPVAHHQSNGFVQERTNLQGELEHLNEQYQLAIQELQSTRDSERLRLNLVETEARKKVRAARSEGREVSERVRVDLTKRLSKKDQEIKEARESLARKEDLIEQWSAERGNIKMLVHQAWALVRNRSARRADRLKMKAAANSARNQQVLTSEWSSTRESAKVLVQHSGRLIKSFLTVLLLFTPFMGARILVSFGFLFGRFGGKGKKSK